MHYSCVLMKWADTIIILLFYYYGQCGPGFFVYSQPSLLFSCLSKLSLLLLARLCGGTVLSE